jgi:hypothetical protein
MASLPNYLRTNRKRLALSQEKVAFLLGGTGDNKGSKVSRDESFGRQPGLRAALAYEVLYGKPVRELFAGLYEEVEQDMARRAKILSYRKGEPLSKHHETFVNLVSKITL